VAVSLSVRSDAPAVSVRLEPVQQRSTRRVENLLDAAARYIHENGFETLTTAHVSELAGSSIGTVYRYFPDRIALLDALAQRNRERAADALAIAMATAAPTGVPGVVEVAVSVLAAMYRDEKGFRALRLGDPLDIRPARDQRWGIRHFARVAAHHFRKSVSAVEQKTLELALDVADTVIAKAYLSNPKGDRALLAQAPALAQSVLATAQP
jgi:AcrR family transcriptional regulator